MAKVKVEVNGEMVNGMMVKFKAPCNCSEVDGLKLSRLTYNGSEYVESNIDFTFRDASGKDVSSIGNLFAEGVLVSVLLDTENRHAYLLNAGTTYHIENSVKRIDNKVSLVTSDTFHPGLVKVWHDTVRKSVCVEFWCHAEKEIASGTEFKLATLDASICPGWDTPGYAFCKDAGVLSVMAYSNPEEAADYKAQIRGRAVAKIPALTNITVRVEYFL